MYKEVEIIQVIKTRLQIRGDGRSENHPLRIITQFWSMNGDLLAEVDPFQPEQTPEKHDTTLKEKT